MAGIVSKNYCDALFALAQEDEKLDVYKEQLNVVADSVKKDDESVSYTHLTLPTTPYV